MTEDRRATRWRAPDEPCLNCGDTTPGRYCPTCGQRKTEVLVSVRTMLADVLEDQLVLNRALPRTITSLLFRPGLLTAEYVRGRIVRYIAPFRLYLVSSVVFFLILSFIGLRGVEFTVDDTEAVSADSARIALEAQQRQLMQIDTAEMPQTARAAVRASLATVTSALDSLARADTLDSPARPDAAAARARAAADSAPAGADTATYAPDTGAPLPPGTLQPWARGLRFDDTPPLIRRALTRKVAQVGHLPLRDAVRELLRDLLEYAPHMVFVLLPFYALLLKLLYIRRSRYYAEHFVFALHVHAFAFVMFTLMILLPDWLDAALVLWMIVYAWLAMKRVYRQGWFRTTLKWWTLGVLYSFALVLGLVGLAFATLLLT
ncbi:MAG TPA: DUF3667 domain-containing protein [Longimicrobiales bacterium]